MNNKIKFILGFDENDDKWLSFRHTYIANRFKERSWHNQAIYDHVQRAEDKTFRKGVNIFDKYDLYDVQRAEDKTVEKKISEWFLFKNIRRCVLFRLLPLTLVLWLIVSIFFENDTSFFWIILFALLIVWIVSFVVGFIANIKTHFLIVSRGKKYKKLFEEKLAKEKKDAYERSITCQYCGTKPFKEENIQYQLIRSYDYTEIVYDYIGDRKKINDRIPYLIEEYVITVKRQCCGTEYKKDGRLEINKRNGYERWR